MRLPNSAEIKFQITRVNSGWYFYVVIADLRKQTPKLFFPENLTTADHLLGNKIRLFPDKSVAYKHDPRGLKLERSEEAPADGDSPWSIYIVITSKRVLPKGDISKTLLTIEDIAEVLDEDDTKVKEFLIDVMMQADGALDRSLYNSTFGAVAVDSRSTDRSQDNPSFRAVAADSRSSEQASRSSSSTSFLQIPTHHMLFVIFLLVAILYQQLLYWSGSMARDFVPP